MTTAFFTTTARPRLDAPEPGLHEFKIANIEQTVSDKYYNEDGSPKQQWRVTWQSVENPAVGISEWFGVPQTKPGQDPYYGPKHKLTGRVRHMVEGLAEGVRFEDFPHCLIGAHLILFIEETDTGGVRVGGSQPLPKNHPMKGVLPNNVPGTGLPQTQVVGPQDPAEGNTYSF